jgi:hypothetical protein
MVEQAREVRAAGYLELAFCRFLDEKRGDRRIGWMAKDRMKEREEVAE